MMAMAMADNEQRMKEELERALVLDEKHVPARIALAKIALAHQSTQEFEQHLESLQALEPDNPNVLLLRAAAEQGRGNTGAALELASKAFDLAPTSATLIVLASYQEAGGDPQSAHKSFAGWLEEHPDDIPVRVAFANSLQLSQRFDEAGMQYAAILQADPDNTIALNNQAWIIREQNTALALEYARKALTLAPNSPEVLDTLAVVEFISKNYEHAARTIERALRANPDNPSMLYHSAMIDSALGDKVAARVTLEKLLAANNNFPEIEEAKALRAQLDN
jgi:tetratricopeptide (TPR) repeat protein